jgi:hypothetical protein
MVMALVIRWQTGDQPESDEINQKLKSIANTCSWLVSIISTTVLLSCRYLGRLVFPSQIALGAVAWVMAGSVAIFLIHFRFKGDAGPA